MNRLVKVFIFVFSMSVMTATPVYAGMFKKTVLLGGAAAAGHAYAKHKQKKQTDKLQKN